MQTHGGLFRPWRLLLCLSVLVGNFSHAQTKTGTSVGQFLLIEPSARAAGMGNVGTALYDEIVSSYFNPGALGRLTGNGVQFTHNIWLADITYDYAAVGIHGGDWGNLLVTLTSLNSGEIDVRTVEQPLGTGERYTVTNLAIGVGYGRQISDRFSAGIQITYIQETIWHSSLSAAAINVGTVYQLSPDGLRIGASISNYGTRARFSGRDLRIRYDSDPTRSGDNSSLPGEIFTEEYPLPVLFRIGVSMPMHVGSDNRILFAVDAFHPSDNTESMSFGAEWLFMNMFAVRGGYQNLFMQDSEVGLTLGAGVQVEFDGYNARFDYGWADHGRLEDTQRFTLGLSF